MCGGGTGVTAKRPAHSNRHLKCTLPARPDGAAAFSIHSAAASKKNGAVGGEGGVGEGGRGGERL